MMSSKTMTIKKVNKKAQQQQSNYNWVAHILEDDMFHQRIVKSRKGGYNRKKEKRVEQQDDV